MPAQGPLQISRSQKQRILRLQPPRRRTTLRRISLADAKKEFDAGTAIFIDTRDPTQYKFEHIKGAINITGAMLDDKYKDIPKDKKIIAYCS